MKKYAKVKKGKVVQTQRSMEDGFMVCPENVHAGMLYDGKIFTNPIQSASNLLKQAKQKKKREIKSSAKIKLLSIHRDYDLNFIKTMHHSWPGLDQTKVKQKLRDAMAINDLMRAALKLVRQATTIEEVNLVNIPSWP